MDEQEARAVRQRLEAILREASFDEVIEFPTRLQGDPEMRVQAEALEGLIHRAQSAVRDILSIDDALLTIEGVKSITFKTDPAGPDGESATGGGSSTKDLPPRLRALRFSSERDQRRASLHLLDILLGGLAQDVRS